MRKFDGLAKTRREIELYARHVGAADTDDLARFLVAWLWYNYRSKDQVGAVMECARTIGRKGLTEAEAEDVVREAKATPRAKDADALGCYLRLDYGTRQALGITRIGSYDADKRERRRRRRDRDRQAKERQRREKGAQTRVEYEAKSISRAKPWEAQGISRITWYRRQKAARCTGPGTAVEQKVNCGGKVNDTSPSTAVLLYAVDTPVSPNKEGLKRGRVPLGEICANQRRVSLGGVIRRRSLR